MKKEDSDVHYQKAAKGPCLQAWGWIAARPQAEHTCYLFYFVLTSEYA
jgi:hypothetical protein